jgi:hypothetical protein
MGNFFFPNSAAKASFYKNQLNSPVSQERRRKKEKREWKINLSLCLITFGANGAITEVKLNVIIWILLSSPI